MRELSSYVTGTHEQFERDGGARPARVLSMERSPYWPSRIGRLRLTGALGTICASYVDPLTGAVYRAGCERGGHRGRRGWWFQVIDESRRSDGYRDFSPGSQREAIHELRTIASATVGTGEWSDVSIEPGDQAALDQWGLSA